MAINGEDHGKLKKLIAIALDNGYLYTFEQRHFALQDMADIIDPEHWNRGQRMQSRNPSRLPDEELNDAYKPNNLREFTPRRAEG